MKITISKEDVDLVNCTRLRTLLENIVNRIEQIVINNNAIGIMTNGNIASCLQDSDKYGRIPLFVNYNRDTMGKPYNIGTISNRILVVNPYQRWDNNIIDIIYDKSTIKTLKINKLLKRNQQIIEKIIIDEEIMNRL